MKFFFSLCRSSFPFFFKGVTHFLSSIEHVLISFFFSYCFAHNLFFFKNTFFHIINMRRHTGFKIFKFSESFFISRWVRIESFFLMVFNWLKSIKISSNFTDYFAHFSFDIIYWVLLGKNIVFRSNHLSKGYNNWSIISHKMNSSTSLDKFGGVNLKKVNWFISSN